MSIVDGTDDDLRAIYVDMGTTNTRVWLMEGSEILARSNHPVGVRDTARDGSPLRIKATLKELIKTVLSQTNGTSRPAYVAAAGMISSPLGLAEIPHVSAPAGVQELANGCRWLHFHKIVQLPFLLTPGVRSGPVNVPTDNLAAVDVMRGEETLCLGLTNLGLIEIPGILLNLGSHWKAIELDSEGRIYSSVTSLSGELIQAAQTQTILARSISRNRPEKLNQEWVQAGMSEQRRSGLPRALFCGRLLELANEGTAEERFSFVVGAFIGCDLDALVVRGILNANTPVVITGYPATAEAWRQELAALSISAVVLGDDDVEKGFLAGLRQVLERALAAKNEAGVGAQLN